MRFKGHQFFIAAAKQDGWGERILSGLATAAVQGEASLCFIFVSTERNKIISFCCVGRGSRVGSRPDVMDNVRFSSKPYLLVVI